jgi:hypothetical protein
MSGRFDFFRKLLRQASALVQVLLLCMLTLQPAFAIRSSSEEPTAWVEVCSNPLPLEEDIPNPLGNSTEENAASSLTLAEEFLHGSEAIVHPSTDLLTDYCTLHLSTYQAFHCEQLIPPPDRG